MPRIIPVEPDAAEPDVKATFAAVKSEIGMVPNLFKTFARSPAVLKGYLGLSEALAAGILSARQREIVALAVAQANSCEYCVSAHTAIGKGAGLSPDAILAARNGNGGDPMDQAIATLAHAVVEARGKITDTQLSDARIAGLTDAHIIEIVASVAFNTLTNFTNNVAHTDIDFPRVELSTVA